MATFNIYGCCICRDLFGFAPDNKHEIIHFLQSTSQITNFVYPTKPLREMTENDFLQIPGMKEFKKKCIINDYNKTVLDYYSKPSDYFIIDLINIANTNLMQETSQNGYEHYFTYSSWFAKAYKAGLDQFFEGSSLKQIDRLRLIKLIGTDVILDNMIRWLTETLGYRQEQIILIENKRAAFYTDGELIHYFNAGTRETVNSCMDDIYKSFEEKCPRCHVIKAPYGSYSDTRHPWSLSDLHYTQDYYDYLYSCVDAIVDNKNCKEKIEELFDKYSRINEKTINRFMEGTISRLSESEVNQQLLEGDFLPTMPCGYIVEKGTASFDRPDVSCDSQPLESNTEISEFNVPYAKTFTGKYVEIEKCIVGTCGTDKTLGGWKTVGRSTCVIVKNFSLILKHSGNRSKAQMNLIQTIEHTERLYGRTVILSVYARVLEFSDDLGRGGTIAIINDSSYNRGVFYAKKEFRNTEWHKIILKVVLPLKDNFFGLTVCLRANAGNEKHAAVEYCFPSLEIAETY